MTTQRHLAFTIRYNGRTNVLQTKCVVGDAFDPSRTTDTTNPIEYIAIWDTGATNTAITKKVVTECDLKPIGITIVNTAAGTKECSRYLISIGLPNLVKFPQIGVTEVELPSQTDVLIGMDIISQGDFAITNVNGLTVFSYRYPSYKEIDYVPDSESYNKRFVPKPFHHHQRGLPKKKKKR